MFDQGHFACTDHTKWLHDTWLPVDADVHAQLVPGGYVTSTLQTFRTPFLLKGRSPWTTRFVPFVVKAPARHPLQCRGHHGNTP